MRIDQYLPVLAAHDGIGAHVLHLREVLRSAGVESAIYAEVLDERLAGEACHYLDGPARPDPARLVLFHASTSSDMTGWLRSRGRLGQRILTCYHNITPASYFRRWLPEAAEAMLAAREELASLAPLTELAIGVSEYNTAELSALGYTRTETAPLLVDLAADHDEADQETSERLEAERSAGGHRWLFVGRIAPNKCQHDVIAAFAAYRRLADPKAQLTLVGGATAPAYREALQRLASELRLGDSVTFAEGLSRAELIAHFHSSDVLVCLSEHEGFCAPLVEAMELGVPVVAFAAAAVPETVAGAGVLLADKDPLTVAVAVAELLADGGRRAQLIAAGRARAAELSLPAAARRWRSLLVGDAEQSG